MGAAHLQADIVGVIVQVTFWTSALFVPAVSTFWPWWTHLYGRAAISIDVLLAAAFLPAELRRLFGISVTSPAFEWFTIGVLACIPLRTTWLAWSIWKIQRHERPARDAGREERTA